MPRAEESRRSFLVEAPHITRFKLARTNIDCDWGPDRRRQARPDRRDRDGGNVLTNDGKTNFNVRFGFPVGSTAIAFGDLNGDRQTDLAVAGGTDASVLPSNGDGAYAPGMSYVAGTSSSSVARSRT